MLTKDFNADEAEECTDFMNELVTTGKTVDVTKTKDGNYRVHWVDQKMYTSFTGQIHPDEVWTKEDGTMLHVQDLEPEHAKNIIRMMLRQSREAQIKLSELANKMSNSLFGDDEDDNVGDVPHAPISESAGHTLH